MKCLLCFNDINEEFTFRTLFQTSLLCKGCMSKLEPIVEQQTPLGLYWYNEAMKEIFFKIKFQGDIGLCKVLGIPLKERLKKYKRDYCIIPIPISTHRLDERGFNQTVEIAKYTGLKIEDCLVRLDKERQSEKSMNERKSNPPLFKMKENYILQYQNVIIFDDIYTSGSTLEAACRILSNANVTRIERVIIAKVRV